MWVFLVGMKPPLLLIDIWVMGCFLTAVLGSRSSISMIQSGLLPTNLLVEWTASIVCFHGHVEECPIVCVVIWYLGVICDVALAWVKTLPYPMLVS